MVKRRRIKTSPDKNTTGNKENTSLVAPDERQRYSKPEIKARQAYVIRLLDDTHMATNKKIKILRTLISIYRPNQSIHQQKQKNNRKQRNRHPYMRLIRICVIMTAKIKTTGCRL
jgi:hypothetical protein